MTTIRRDADCATLINVFTVEPESAAELATLMRVGAVGVPADGGHLFTRMSGNLHNIHLTIDVRFLS